MLVRVILAAALCVSGCASARRRPSARRATMTGWRSTRRTVQPWLARIKASRPRPPVASSTESGSAALVAHGPEQHLIAAMPAPIAGRAGDKLHQDSPGQLRVAGTEELQVMFGQMEDEVRCLAVRLGG